MIKFVKNLNYLFLVIVLLYFYFSWNYLTISNDALYQLTVLNNLYHGFGPMDNLIINKGYVAEIELLKWWSPLSYLVPFLISKILFISYTHAITICLTISICLAIWILNKIGSMFGLSQNSVYLLIFCFVLQRVNNINFLQFTGGDMFILPIGLYQFYITYKIINETDKAHRLIYFLLLSIIGVLFKLNYVIYVFAFLGVLSLFYFHRKEYKKIPSLVVIFGFVAIVVYFFTSGSGTANETVTSQHDFLSITQAFIIPIIGVLFSFFSVQSILANIPSKSNTYFDVINSWTIEGVWLGLGIITITLFLFWKEFRNNKLITFLTGIVVVFYSYFYLKGAYVGHEDRYFVLSSVFLVFCLYAVAKGQIQRMFFHSLFAISALYGIWNFAYRFHSYNSHSNSIVTKNFGLIRTPNSSEENKTFRIIGGYINRNFPKYAIYTSNESYFYFQSSKNALIHDWNFQIMGFEQFEIEKINQIRFASKTRINGIVFISNSLLKNNIPTTKIGNYYLYTIKNQDYE